MMEVIITEEIEILKIIKLEVADKFDRSPGEISQAVEKKLNERGLIVTKELQLYKFVEKALKEFNEDTEISYFRIALGALGGKENAGN